jgi:hypothetical protein
MLTAQKGWPTYQLPRWGVGVGSAQQEFADKSGHLLVPSCEMGVRILQMVFVGLLFSQVWLFLSVCLPVPIEFQTSLASSLGSTGR